MKGAETESATQSAAGSKSGDVSIRTLEDLLRRYPIMRYHTRPWAAWPSSAHRCSEAKNSLQKAVRLNPKSVKANYKLGLLLAPMGKKDKAEDRVKIAKSLQTEDASSSHLQL